jgi:hypothetical protein
MPPVAEQKAPKDEVPPLLPDAPAPLVTLTGPGIDGAGIHLIAEPPPPPEAKFPAGIGPESFPPPPPTTVTLMRCTVAGLLHVPGDVKTFVVPLFSA